MKQCMTVVLEYADGAEIPSMSIKTQALGGRVVAFGMGDYIEVVENIHTESEKLSFYDRVLKRDTEQEGMIIAKTKEEARAWFLAHSAGTLICERDDEVRGACNCYPDAERFFKGE